MTEQDALAVALAEASPRVVGIRAEAEAILAAAILKAAKEAERE